jgi:hypothetical protein
MPSLPDKILSDAQISIFVDRVNSRSKEIISDSKFEIPNPALPGVGMLIKLLIRSFEKGVASFLAPVLLGKKVIDDGLGEIDDLFETVGEIFSNPLQFIIDEGINKSLQEFPFPIAFKVGSPYGDVNKLKELIDKAGDPRLGDVSGSTNLVFYNYDLIFSTTNSPKSGEITTFSSDVNSIRQISVSYKTNNNEDNDSLKNLDINDKISLSDGNKNGVFVITEIFDGAGERKLTLSPVIIENTEDANFVYIPGFSGISNPSSLLLRNFIGPDGSVLIPLSVLGINFPLISSLNLNLGNFNSLPDTSPTKNYLAQLGQDSGLDFNEVFSGVLTGKFPSVDFKKMQETGSAGSVDPKEKAKEDVIAFARLMQISVENPFFLIKIVVNYFKLLLLPINVIVGVLKGLSEKITNPVKLIKTIISGITNPLRLICDLVAEGFLQFLEPYLGPFVNPIMPYSSALVDPDNSSRGLKPLFSDLICGKFKDGLDSYVPDQSFFEEQSRLLSSNASGSNTVNLPYYILTDGSIPENGNITVDTAEFDKVRSIRVSSFTNTVENSLAVLTATPINSTISLSVDGSYYSYRVNFKSYLNKEGINYFEFLVSLDSKTAISDTELVKSGSNPDKIKALLTASNPDKTFLFIVEKYLPVKLISVWESIKGILGITIALASEIPTIVPTVVKSVLTGDPNSNEVTNYVISPNEVSELINQFLQFMYAGDKSLLFVATDPIFPAKKKEAADAIQNSSTDTSPGIETPFFELYAQLTESGRDNFILKDNLSTASGGFTDDPLLRDSLSGSQSLLEAKDFYYSQLSLEDLGKAVKVLSVIYFSLTEYPFYSAFPNSREDTISGVYITSGNTRSNIFNGTIIDGLEKYKVTTASTSSVNSPREIRVFINREINFIYTYLLPSIK